MGKLFLKRLKGLSIRVGFDNPSVVARDVYNPILNFLDE